MPFSGTLEYPVPLPDLNADPNAGAYDFSAGSLSWTIGSHTFQNSPSMFGFSQGDESVRQFIVQSYDIVLPAGWSLTGIEHYNELALQMVDFTFIPDFVGGDLPASSVDFSAFTYSQIAWSFMVDDFVLQADGLDYSNAGNNTGGILGIIDSITVSVVPEPTAFAMLGIVGVGLGGCVWRRRRR
ncbi:MAG: PEP-CTERM sorting domain-containing protein [Pirellulales bacterium]|nr:PEP-CTERM sorting domain-containing protein [Pirellulales bacterium]